MKKLLSLALAMIMIVATLTTVFTINGFATDDEDDGVITPDTSWYDASKTEFEIADAADFLGFALLLNGIKNQAGDAYDVEPVTFKGKTVKLTADIDVNPDWNEDEYFTNKYDEGEGSDLTLAIPPVNEWPVKSYGAGGSGVVFEGTLDGQNHYVSGIYANFPAGAGSTNDFALFGGAGSDTTNTVTIKNIAFVNSYMSINCARAGGLLTSGKSKIVFENVYNGIDIANGRTSNDDVTGGFICYSGYSGAGEINFKKCVYAGTMKAVGGAISGFQAITNDANQVAKFEDCLVVGTFIGGGKQAGIITKNKGIVNLNTVAVNATFDPTKAYVVGCDLRNGTGNNITTTSVIYTDGEGENACKSVYQLHANNTVDNPTATKATVENLKNLSSWAVAQSIAGFSDWTATIEDGGIKMPITADLAAAVKAFSAPAVTPDENPGGDNNEENQTPADDNDKKDDTTEAPDTEAPESTKAAETTEAAEEKGCGGVIGAGAIAIVAVTGAALAIGAKKKED